MSEYLEKKCVNLGIRLVYTYNKSTVLSAEINSKKPLLIADMMFKNCPESISQAIIGFYTDKERKKLYEKIITNYVEDYFRPYAPGKIKYLDLSYLINSIQSINVNYKVKFDMDSTNTAKVDANDQNLVELDIASMNGKDFWDGEKQYKANSSINPSNDEELQLNIVVLPPAT